jgi:hypothetical protein
MMSLLRGVVNPKSRLESSVSVSSIELNIEQSAPRSTGEVLEIFLDRAESSGVKVMQTLTVVYLYLQVDPDTYNCKRMDYQLCCLEIRLWQR